MEENLIRTLCVLEVNRMKDMILIGLILALFLVGYYIMKKIDFFLDTLGDRHETNTRTDEEP